MNDKKKKELARIIAGRMSPKAPQDIDKVRSTMGQIKGALTKDTLYRLRQIVADHQNAGEDEDPNIRIYRLTIIMGLCGDYLNRHGKETDARAQGRRSRRSRRSRRRPWSRGAAPGRSSVSD